MHGREQGSDFACVSPSARRWGAKKAGYHSCRLCNLLAGADFRGRYARPAPKCVVERGLVIVAEQEGNLTQPETPIRCVLKRQLVPHVVEDIPITAALLFEPSRKSPWAHSEFRRHAIHACFPFGQKAENQFSHPEYDVRLVRLLAQDFPAIAFEDLEQCGVGRPDRQV